MRTMVTLACTECKRRNYTTKKNKQNNPERMEGAQCGVAGGVLARGVCERLALHDASHGVDGGRARARRGGVVEVGHVVTPRSSRRPGRAGRSGPRAWPESSSP